jgi:hypothetical protein
MKRFFNWALLLLLITFSLDRIGSFVMKELYAHSNSTDEYKINYVTNKMNQPIVFMGSSRCHHSYVPSIISDTLGVPVYNAGLWGERNIYFQYGLLCNILERYIPKVICLEIHPIDFMQTPYSGIEHIAPLAPFIGKSTGCDSLFKVEKKYTEYKILHLLRYNSNFVSLVGGCLFVKNSQKDNGYKPLLGITDYIVKPDEFKFSIDQQRVKILLKFINECKKKKIKLILLCSPMYAVSNSCIQAYNIPLKIARVNELQFLNHLTDNEFVGKRNLFYDRGHFNDKGAKLFSSKIAHELKSIVIRKK